jgi:hypothetical protein
MDFRYQRDAAEFGTSLVIHADIFDVEEAFGAKKCPSISECDRGWDTFQACQRFKMYVSTSSCHHETECPGRSTLRESTNIVFGIRF